MVVHNEGEGVENSNEPGSTGASPQALADFSISPIEEASDPNPGTEDRQSTQLATLLSEIKQSDPNGYDLVLKAISFEGISVEFNDKLLKETTTVARRFEAGEVIAAKAIADEIASKIFKDAEGPDAKSSLEKYMSVKAPSTSDIVEFCAQTGLNAPHALELFHLAFSRHMTIETVFNKFRRVLGRLSPTFEKGEIPAVDQIRALPDSDKALAIEVLGDALRDDGESGEEELDF